MLSMKWIWWLNGLPIDYTRSQPNPLRWCKLIISTSYLQPKCVTTAQMDKPSLLALTVTLESWIRMFWMLFMEYRNVLINTLFKAVQESLWTGNSEASEITHLLGLEEHSLTPKTEGRCSEFGNASTPSHSLFMLAAPDSFAILPSNSQSGEVNVNVWEAWVLECLKRITFHDFQTLG